MIPKFIENIDVSYSLKVTETLRGFVSNEVLGFRTAGSEAEKKAADFLYNEFKKLGLANVRKEKVMVDTFEFKKAEIKYTDNNCIERKVVMSAYQANCFAWNEPVEIIYVNKGRDIDYENIDAEGKMVLLDIDMLEEWWVNWPLCQAKVKGAKGIITVNISGYCSYAEDCIGVQDACSPSDMPAFSISVADAKHLKEAIKQNGGSIKAFLTADVSVTEGGYSYDVIGEIPGNSIDEVIYLIGHYDAYFRAFDDNSAGIGCMLGIINAFVKSGYKPNRTLRIICHGAEEWAITDSRYDWARGATMLTWNHPEWKKDGFLLVNIDGNTVNSTATAVQLRTAYEMAEGMEKIGQSVDCALHEIKTISPIWTWTESYMYNLLGIPSVESGYEGVNFWGSYHSNYDLKEVNFYSDEEYRSSHIVYGFLLQIFDKLKVRPLKFENMFSEMKKSVEGCAEAEGINNLKDAIEEAILVARQLTGKNTNSMSNNELTVFNEQISRISEAVTKKLFGINWSEEYDFVHVRYSDNVINLKNAITALVEGDIIKALDRYIANIDLTWYGYYFSYDVYKMVVNQTLNKAATKTWASGMLTNSADLWELSRSLIAKRNKPNVNVEEEIGTLDRELKFQIQQLNITVAKEIESVNEIIDMMRKCI